MLSAPTAAACRLTPDHPALVWRGDELTYRALEDRVLRAGTALRRMGVGKGDVVAVRAAPSPHWVAIAHALGRLGAILFPVNLRLAEPEVAWQLQRAEAKVVLVDPPRSSHGLALDSLFASEPEELAEGLDPHLPHSLIFTSGTTGRPKGVVLSWSNQVSSAVASAAALGLHAHDRWLMALPLFHVGGLNILHRCAIARATVVLHDRFDPAAVIRSLGADGVTLASMVPAMLRKLLDMGGDRPLPGSLRGVLVGGGPIPPDLLERCPQALPTYGLTEACSHVTLARAGSGARDTAGPCLLGTDVRIVDETGAPMAPGGIGLIEVRSPTVMAGYWKDLEATRAVLQDGWLKTGDYGSLDDRGGLRVWARRQDLIVSGGENVYPAEIEGVLTSHPDVLEAAVLGMDDATWGQVPIALVVPRGTSLDLEALRGHLTARLASYKHPRRIRVVEALPRLANEKVDRVALRRLVEA